MLFQKWLLVKEVLSFPLSKGLKNPMKELIDIQIKDNECFKWCFVKKKIAKIRNVDNEFAKQLDFKGVKFPVHKKY